MSAKWARFVGAVVTFMSATPFACLSIYGWLLFNCVLGLVNALATLVGLGSAATTVLDALTAVGAAVVTFAASAFLAPGLYALRTTEMEAFLTERVHTFSGFLAASATAYVVWLLSATAALVVEDTPASVVSKLLLGGAFAWRVYTRAPTVATRVTLAWAFVAATSALTVVYFASAPTAALVDATTCRSLEATAATSVVNASVARGILTPAAACTGAQALSLSRPGVSHTAHSVTDACSVHFDAALLVGDKWQVRLFYGTAALPRDATGVLQFAPACGALTSAERAASVAYAARARARGTLYALPALVAGLVAVTWLGLPTAVYYYRRGTRHVTSV